MAALPEPAAVREWVLPPEDKKITWRDGIRAVQVLLAERVRA